ncbi:unnamed protein product [Polarella glacialis]|uniref:Protein xylosyltransferase n=1 Tax=Polarella glacialis TaxID=89957 RepID=A0A813JUM1_POLGL|nr:unnamed protein product [Polarella glacialis]
MRQLERHRLFLTGGVSVLVTIGAFFPAAAEAEASQTPRYVLCEQRAQAAEVKLGGGDGPLVSVYAASVMAEEEGLRHWRRPSALSLRAALLVHDGWSVVLPKRTDGVDGQEHSGHARDASYAKCIGAGLPSSTEVLCRVGSGEDGRHFAPNASWEQGRLAEFRNTELTHDFALCNLGSIARRWQRRPHLWPSRLRMQLGLRRDEGDTLGVMQLELCRVDRPWMNVSFCSQPLYNFQTLGQELPWVMEDWLEYHLGHFGFEHGEVYDIDGSFAQALEPWARASSWRSTTLTYHRKWPSKLSSSLQEFSKDHPYCTETLAYAHCLTTHRALSSWVALLHAPDEYLHAHKHRERGALQEVVAWLQTDLHPELPFSFFQVNGVSFARGGPGSEETAGAAAGRGSVIAASKLRMPMVYHHTPLIDPENCMCAGPHMCYGEVDRDYRIGVTREVPPMALVVHHYVEMMERNRGRCRTMGKQCSLCTYFRDKDTVR